MKLIPYAIEERLERIRENYTFLHISFLISLALFFGLFFGLTYPEYLQTKYVETDCTVVAINTKPNYACGKSCSYCGWADRDDPGCHSQIKKFQKLDPFLCDTDPAQCAQSGTTCNNGYKCCQTICQTCMSCTTDRKGTKTCIPYRCNCYCAVSTHRHRCTINCHQVYTAEIEFSFKLRNNDDASGFYKEYFGKTVENANNFLIKYEIGQVVKCYYDPGSPTNVEIDGDFFTIWKFVILGIFGIFPLLICLMIYTYIAYSFCIHSFSFVLYLTLSTWFGIVIPFGILIPIAYLGYRTDTKALVISTIIISSLGNIPLLIYSTAKWAPKLWQTLRGQYYYNSIPIASEVTDDLIGNEF